MIEKFKNYLQFEKRYSQYTCNAYFNDVLQYEEYLSKEYSLSFAEAENYCVRSWVVSLKQVGLKNKTLHRKISSIRSFYKYLQIIGDLNSDPTKGIKLPKIEKRLPTYIKEKEISRILNVEEKGFSLQRDYLIFMLLYSTGMRRAELVNLQISSISNDSIKVLGKGNKERIIPIVAEINTLIELYKVQRNLLFGQVESNFFLTDKGNKLYEKFVYRVVNRYLGQVSSVKQKSPHILRHTFATQMLNNGADLNSIKELLGHSSLASTQVYTHNSMEKIKEVYKSAHPRSTK